MSYDDQYFVCMFDDDNVEIDNIVSYLAESKIVEIEPNCTFPFISEDVFFYDENEEIFCYTYNHELYNELYENGKNPDVLMYFGKELNVIECNKKISQETHHEFTFTPINRIRFDKPSIWFDNTLGFAVNKSEILGNVFILTMRYDALRYLDNVLGLDSVDNVLGLDSVIFLKSIFFKFIKNIQQIVTFTNIDHKLIYELLVTKNPNDFKDNFEKAKEDYDFLHIDYYNREWNIDNYNEIFGGLFYSDVLMYNKYSKFFNCSLEELNLAENWYKDNNFNFL